MKIIIQTFTLLLISGYAPGQQVSINEEKFISIGGIEQWITIKGADTTRPVILFLHGGPGSVMSPFDTIFHTWKNQFVLVNWDQRGAGKTFGKNAPADLTEDYWIENPLTIGRMADDAIELSEYLIRILGKKKIIITGTSWGTVIGSNIALKRPDLYYAYISHSQVVDAREGLKSAYHKSLLLAEKDHDSAGLNKLRLIGPPPYGDAQKAGQLLRIIKQYETAKSTPAPQFWWIPSSPYNNDTDTKNRYDGDDYSFINYMGHEKMGIKPMMSNINFFNEELNYKIPFFIIQGEHDILTPKEISQKYFDKMNAPQKKFFLLPNSAHGYNQEVLEEHYRILTEYILKIIELQN